MPSSNVPSGVKSKSPAIESGIRKQGGLGVNTEVNFISPTMHQSFVVASLIISCVVIGASANPNGLGATPPMGWNTWCTSSSCYQAWAHYKPGPLHDVCNSGMVREVAQAMIDTGMQALGYRFVNLDDCWEWVSRDANGSLTWDVTRFPEGIPALADWLHGKGFKFGIYISAGTATCSSGGRPAPIPGSYGNYTQDAQTLASWQVDYVKMDWCNYHYPNNGSRMSQILQTKEMAAALNATGRKMWLNFHCDEGEPPHQWCIDDGNSFRIGHDHHDNWKSTYQVISESLSNPNISAQGGPTHWNDPDFLTTGGGGCDRFEPGLRCPGQTENEYRSEFSLWAVNSGALLVTSDVRNMSDFQRYILLNEEMIGLDQTWAGDNGRLLDKVHCGGNTSCSIFGKALSTDGSVWGVALFNPNEATVGGIDLDFKLLQLDAQTLYARDLWQHRELGAFKATFTAQNVGAHDTQVYALSTKPGGGLRVLKQTMAQIAAGAL